ncbi:MAG: hypothetical protein AAGA31_14310 [Bacteroidota bacterium]
MKKIGLIIYASCWLFLAAFLFFVEIPVSNLFTGSGIVVTHLLFVLILLPVSLTRYLYFANKKGRLVPALKRITFTFLLPVGAVFLVLKIIVLRNQAEDFNYDWDYTIENKRSIANNGYEKDGKIRGLSIYAVGRGRKVALGQVVKSNVEWVAVHPYINQLDEQSVTMSLPSSENKWSKADSVFIQEIRQAKSLNFKIMLKPHLWLANGWRGKINFAKASEWNDWFNNYKVNILHYAKMAELAEVELLCIGTELSSSVAPMETEWIELVAEVREVYSGKLVYAANWDDDCLTDQVGFWKELDFIGVQAYYPLTEMVSPSLKEIKAGWIDYLSDLEKIYALHGKPILFTELGYRADTEATIRPWEWNTVFSPLTRKRSEETQLLAFEAFFQQVWRKDWFAGVFIWQWNQSIDFTIEGKPAQNCLAKWYRSD